MQINYFTLKLLNLKLLVLNIQYFDDWKLNTLYNIVFVGCKFCL